MKKIFFISVVFFLLVSSAKAQYYYDRSKNPDRVPDEVKQKKVRMDNSTGEEYRKYFYVAWDYNQPMSNKRFINQPSAIGLKLGFRKSLNDEDRLWWGFGFGWTTYKQHFPYQTYTYGSQAISTEVYNYSYNYSLTLNIEYYFLPMEKMVTPFIGLGVGAAYDKFAQYYNIYANSTSAWGVLLNPQIGVLIGFKENSPWRIMAAAHFDYASNKANLNNNNFLSQASDVNYYNFTNTGFQLGLLRMIH